MQKREEREYHFLKTDSDNIFISKKGLSEIVATLLIILVTLIAVGIVWVVVKNVVQKGADQIELGQYTLDLQIKSVETQDENVTLVVVKRNPGEGEFIGMNFVFSDGQNSETIHKNASLAEGDTKSFTFTLTQISPSALKSVSVYPIYRLASGSEQVGSISDSFDVKTNKSMGTGAATSKFAELGFTDAGRTEYSISSSDSSPIKFGTAVIDPLDVKPGDNQTLTVRVYSTAGTIVNVTARTELDNEALLLVLQKTGVEAGYDVYSVTWTVYDTHVTEYKTNFTAKDSAGNSKSIVLTWTDDCTGLTHGSAWTANQDCTVGVDSVAGLDTGNIVISSGVTLTLNSGSTFAWTPGNSITVSGTIASSGSGALKKGYVYYTDGDGDARGSSATYSFSTSSSASGFVRAKDASGTSDCNDGSGSVWFNGYTDGDGDGVGTGSLACNNGVASTGDCNDANSTLWTTGYGKDADGDGSGISGSSSCQNGASPFTGTSASDCNDGDANNQFNGWAPDEDGDGWGNSLGCNNGAPDGPDECPNNSLEQVGPCT